MKKDRKLSLNKLRLAKETVRRLDNVLLGNVAGGRAPAWKKVDSDVKKSCVVWC